MCVSYVSGLNGVICLVLINPAVFLGERSFGEHKLLSNHIMWKSPGPSVAGSPVSADRSL